MCFTSCQNTVCNKTSIFHTKNYILCNIGYNYSKILLAIKADESMTNFTLSHC